MITPTVGRVVWFHRRGYSMFNPNGVQFVDWGTQPCAAQIAYVWGDRMVNLVVTDHAGNQFPAQSVPLVQEGDAPLGGWYCEWMPYQKGQAARTELVERAALEGGVRLT